MVTISLKELIARHGLGSDDFVVYDDKLCILRRKLRDPVGTERAMRYPVRADFFSWVMVERGDLTLNIGMETVKLHAGMACFCDAGNIVSSQFRSDELDSYAVMFDSSIVESIHLPIQKIVPYISETQSYHAEMLEESWRRHMNQVIELLRSTILECSHLVSYREMVMSLISFFFYTLLGYGTAKRQVSLEEQDKDMSRKQTYFRKFLSDLRNHFRSERNVGFYAERACVSAKYFSTVVREVSGRSPSQWIDECVVAEAKNLLRFSDMSIQEISYELNFPSQSYFGRYFKKHTGMSPRTYRRL